jgi:RND family efflux transporter MFP subunit
MSASKQYEDGRLSVRGKRYSFIANLLAIIAVAAAIIAAGCKSKGAPESAAPEVTVANPDTESVTDYLEFTGNTVSTDSVSLVARVEGYLEKISFIDGRAVKKGQVLFTIQQDQYKAQLQQAKAQVAAAKAAVWHSTTELARYTRLLKQDAATQTEVDHWRYEKESSEANLKSAEAQVILAQLNLDYTTIKAPFDGRIGRHLVDPGNLVGAMGQQTTLAEIDRIDPIYVYFTISERDLLRIRARVQAKETPSFQHRAIPAYFGLLNENGYPHEGRVDFASISVAPTTGTLQLRAIFPNDELAILPGLFVRVRVPAQQHKEALLVPGDAVSFDQQGEYVLVVDDKNIVQRRSVKTGAQVGDKLVIDEGLSPQDRVVVEGLLQAIPGREVNPQLENKSAASASSS